MPQADLELTLHRRERGALRHRPALCRLIQRGRQAGKRPRTRLLRRRRTARAQLDPAATGVYLAQQLLAGEDVRGFFREALTAAQTRSLPLSLRLTAGPSAPELHSLRWETLRLATEDPPLFTGDNVRFSRFLSPWIGGR